MDASDLPLGVVHDMPAAKYHAVDAMSNSALSALKRSPRHYWAEYINPQRPQRKTTAAMAAGTLAHALVLEPAAVAERYVVRPDGLDLRTKDGKAWRASMPSHLDLIDADQMATAEAQAEAVQSVPELAALLHGGASEVSFFWVDPETGTHCKARADHVHRLADGRVILLDLKTTSDASPEQFARSAWSFGYHRQDAWYSRGYELATGEAVAAFVFGVVTGDYPFIAVPYMLDDAAKAIGAEQCRDLLATYAQCKAAGYWPAYGGGVQLLSLPAWAK